MPIHIRAEPGDYAEACLLPGDPLRAKYIAETYLEDVVQRNEERGLLGYTGTFEGKPVSVRGTGMGCPGAKIVFEELIQLGVKKLLRVGTCGGLQAHHALGDLIVALSAVADDRTADHLVGHEPHCPTASWELIHGAVHAAKKIGQPMHVGPIVSSDVFYNPDENQYERWSNRGVLAVEMEASALFTVGALRGVQAGCLLTVSDIVVEGEFKRITDDELRAAEDGAGLLVVGGGDGSVSEVVNGIAGRDGVAIAMIPRGTGWDFARSLGLPRNVDRAIHVALSGKTRTIDLGRATYRPWAGGEGKTWFANVASAGMSGAIAQRANDTTKALGGKVSYVWATFAVFARWSNTEVHVTVDGETREGRMHDVIVSNGQYIGGGMKSCPDADLEDGAFHVLLIGDLTKRDLLLTLPKTFRGEHLPHPRAELLRGATVSVDAPEPLPVELDGEQPGTTPARFEIVPLALRVRVP